MRILSFGCLNRNCQHEFTTQVEGEQFPSCPNCGGLKVKWLPQPFGIRSEATKRADRAVREIQETYGDKNYNSPRRYEHAAPRVNPSSVPGKTVTYSPAGSPGWAGSIPMDAAGNVLPACVPTGVSARLATPMDRAAPRSSKLGAGSQIEGSYRPKGGIPS